jgi:hypothetical protein
MNLREKAGMCGLESTKSEAEPVAGPCEHGDGTSFSTRTGNVLTTL